MLLDAESEASSSGLAEVPPGPFEQLHRLVAPDRHVSRDDLLVMSSSAQSKKARRIAREKGSTTSVLTLEQHGGLAAQLLEHLAPCQRENCKNET